MYTQTSPASTARMRALVAFVVLFVLYQSAEGIGKHWLHAFPVQAAFMLACVLAAWPLSRWFGYRGYGAWALTASARGMIWLIGGLLLALMAKLAALWFGERQGIYVAIAPPSDVSAMAWLIGLPMLLTSTFVPSLAEDIITRGFWYRAAGIRWRTGVAFVALSALMFVLDHIYRLAQGPSEWLMLGCMGLAYATALWRTGTLWAAVGLHWGWNLANGVFDHFMPHDAVNTAGSDLLSASVHLLIVAILLLVPTTRAASTAHPDRSRAAIT